MLLRPLANVHKICRDTLDLHACCVGDGTFAIGRSGLHLLEYKEKVAFLSEVACTS